MADNADQGIFYPALEDPLIDDEEMARMAGIPQPPAPAPAPEQVIAAVGAPVDVPIWEPVPIRRPLPVGFDELGGAILHTLRVPNGRNVYNQLMLLRQHGNILVLSAHGSLSVVTVQRVIDGAVQFFEDEGNFDIISLSGSYVRIRGIPRWSLSVCYCPTNGEPPLRAGVVGGRLIAAGLVLVSLIMFDEAPAPAPAPIIMPPPPKGPPHKRPPPSDGSQGSSLGSRPLQRGRFR